MAGDRVTQPWPGIIVRSLRPDEADTVGPEPAGDAGFRILALVP